jgi:hypothetical protein
LFLPNPLPFLIDRRRQPPRSDDLNDCSVRVGDFECLDQAERRGLDLLRAWLSPEQGRQFDETSCFEVIGCDTGARYLIHYARQLNIAQLDATGCQVKRLCFGPEGRLVTGDIMLAQKIALETMELSALAKANVRPPGSIPVTTPTTMVVQQRRFRVTVIQIMTIWAIGFLLCFYMLILSIR